VVPVGILSKGAAEVSVAGNDRRSFRLERSTATRFAVIYLLSCCFLAIAALRPPRTGVFVGLPRWVVAGTALLCALGSAVLAIRLSAALIGRTPSVVVDSVGVTDYTRAVMSLGGRPRRMAWVDLRGARIAARGLGSEIILDTDTGPTVRMVSVYDRPDLRQAIEVHTANSGGGTSGTRP
jgi:hypothetical protein